MIELTAALLKKTNPAIKRVYRRPLSTGLSVLNCALTGSCQSGIESGTMVWMSGESDSGRTVAAITLLAEACLNNEFAGYHFYYNDTEGKSPNIARIGGGGLANRVAICKVRNHEQFWEQITGGKLKTPFIYVLDSIDGLFGENGTQVNNSRVKGACDYVREHDSILVILSQQKVVASKKVAAGGAALPFYADYILHTEREGQIIKIVRGKNRVVGIMTKFSVIKRKYGGKFKSIQVPIYDDYGFDNAEAGFVMLQNCNKISCREDKLVFDDLHWQCNNEPEMVALIRNNEKLVDYYIEHVL